MRGVSSALSMFMKRANPKKPPKKDLHAGDAVMSHPLSDAAIYPTGQTYAWGGPSTASHGFAPAIGYDGYHGGNGY